MTAKELEIAFQNAVDKVNSHKEPFPADVLLRLYAFYKVATRDQSRPGSKTPLINAFKANALFQVQEMDIDEAKKSYVAYADKYFQSIS
ncbi:hypothetical protein NBRC110019_11260 [Neptunitalea chrysea]|uniref:ACB domain-containing protein n=1 Tax=Neptunitalea chrysea TaxID=1647581 RepID=A0A9W6EV46_9FLAO|nr:acyl-CoA-binding protein [Neptunitalea chrysea]GLB52087.1 hypothetical protein NBRC110019_11260 [Neptunitalea chrysea]